MEKNVEQLVNEHLRLLQRIANDRYWKVFNAGINCIQKEELENEGYFGLMTAAQKFDPEIGTAFTWYAQQNIHNAISLFLRRQDPLRPEDRKAVKNMLRVKEKLSHGLGRDPSETEVAKELGISVENVRTLQAKLVFLLSIDDPEFGKAEEYLKPSFQRADDVLAKKELQRDTDVCLKTSLNREQRIVLLLKHIQGYKTEEIAQATSLSVNQVNYLLQQAKLNMKDCLESKGWDVSDISE